MPPQTPPSDGPEIPPDIPPEFVDAYLAGFQRGYGGEVQPVVSEPVEVTPEHEPAAGLDRPTDDADRPRIDSDRPTDDSERPTDDDLDPPTDEIGAPTDEIEAPTVVVEERGLDRLDRPVRNRPNTERPEDMEWLFERDRDAPLGWAFNPADESTSNPSSNQRTGFGSTSTATEGSAREASGRAGRSPWVVLIGFLAILVVLMLVAYIGGMAFSTIVDR